MTAKQKLFLWVGAAIIILMIIFPPVRITEPKQGQSGISGFHAVVKYSLLFDNPVRNIYYQRLLLQCVIVLILTIVSAATFCSAKDHKCKTQTTLVLELRAYIDHLRSKIQKIQQSEAYLKQYLNKLISANKNLKLEVQNLCLSEKKTKESRIELEEIVLRQQEKLTSTGKKLDMQTARQQLTDGIIKKQTAKLTAANIKLQREIIENAVTQDCLKKQISDLIEKRGKLSQIIKNYQLLENQTMAETPIEDEIPTLNGFDLDKLKQLSELAKRLT